MSKNTYYLKNEVQKPNEVYELKKNEYQTPTFEEFMKTYEVDENLNYSDLESGSVGEVKGYGPCNSCSNYYADFVVILEAEWGVDGQWFFGIPTYRSPKRYIDYSGGEAKNFLESITTATYNMDGIWQFPIMKYKIRLDNTNKAEELLRHFAYGNLKVRGRGGVHHRGAENVLINTVRTALSEHRAGRDVNINRNF